MKASGNLLNFILFALCLIIFAFPTMTISGNSWMMEKNRDELILLNTELLEQLGAINQNGEVLLQGSVVIRNGQKVLKIHQLQKFTFNPATEGETANQSDEDKSYRVFLREESLPEVPVIKSNTP